MASAATMFGCAYLLLSAAAAGGDQTVKPGKAEAAARGLVQRLLPAQADRFDFEQIPADDGRDVFEIESRGGKVVIRGNNGVSMAMGLNWYLKHYCHCHVSWYGNQLESARSAAASAAEGPAGQLGQASLLPELLLLRLFAAVVGLGAVGDS